MKIFRILSLALMAVVLCAGFAACSNESDNPVIQEEKKMCTVNINVESLVKIEEVPMGRAGESAEEKNDLYLISFSKSTGYSDIYAYGLFDDLSNISIQLVEGETYGIQASAVKNAKSKIACTQEGLYANPFRAKVTNSFVYENDTDFDLNWYFNPTYYTLKDMPSGFSYALIAPDLEVFLGYTISSYEAKENGDPISISFGRFAACSAEFKAVDMPTGKLKISITNADNEYTTGDIIVQSETQSTFQYITFGHTLYSSIQNAGVPCTLNLTWVKDSNTEIPLKPAEITFKRDTKYIITIKVDNTTTPTISVTPIGDYGFTSTEEVNILGQPIPTGNN